MARSKCGGWTAPEPVLLAEDRLAAVVAIDLDGDGCVATDGRWDGRVVVVERATGQSRLLPHQVSGLRALAVRRDRRELALAHTDKGRYVLSVHSLDRAEATATLEQPAEVESIAWHPHGRRLAATDAGSRIHLWEVGQPRPLVLEGCGNRALWPQYSPSGDVLVSNGWEWTVRFWDTHTGQQLLNLPGTGSYHLGPDGRTLAVESPAGRRSVEFVHRE